MRMRFLSENGIDVPKSEIPALARKKGWVDIYRQGKLAATMRWDPSDWYLCTVKNAVVRKDLRGRGIGRYLYKRTVKEAFAAKTRSGESMCHVLAADVTSDNMPSIRALKSAGFAPVNRFCWKRGEKPADVLHYVKMPPKGKRCP